MSTQLQIRRGSTNEHNGVIGNPALPGFTGAQGEITVDIDKNVTVIHDGNTVGGHPSVSAKTLATEDGAGLIGINDAGGLYAATTVEAALQEVKTSNNIGYLPAGTGASTDRSVQDKLRESVSVLDFKNADDTPVLGDGIQDDTTGIQAAIDYCAASTGINSVYFPPGDYYISGTLQLKVGVSLVGSGKSLVNSTPYSRIKGAGGTQTLVKYTGTFGSEARISLSIRELQFANCQIGIHLVGAACWDIKDCTFPYIRGTESHSAIVLEGGILGVIEGNIFFFDACAIRLDKGINYHVTIRGNDFNIDTGAGIVGGYKAYGVLVRCDSTNIGFGPLSIENNNFIPAKVPGTNQTFGIYVAARGNTLNITGNTFEAMVNSDVTISPIDPITTADHTSDAGGFFVHSGTISGNWHVDGASGGSGNYCYDLNYTHNMAFMSNNLKPQISVTGRSIVFFDANSTKNSWHGDNLITYKSGYTGAGVEESNSTYGTNIIIENAFINSTTDGPAYQNIINGHSRLVPQSEFAGRLSQFGIEHEGVEWVSSVSKRKMLVLSDGSSVVHARQSIETAPLYTNPSTTVTLNGTERTLRFFTGGTVATISGATYDGQILSVFNSSSLTVTLNETGNIRVNGGTTLVLAQDEGATFVWWLGGTIWVQI
jgi:hypothetical protein